MSDLKGKKPGFHDFLNAIKHLHSGRGLNNNVFLAYGKSSWLIQDAVHSLRQSARKAGSAIVTLEAKDISDGRLTDMFSQSSLFEPSTLYIVYKAEQAKSLHAKLSSTDFPEMTNKIALILSNDRIPAALAKITGKKSLLEVPCFQPWPNEMPKAIEAFAALEGLKFDSGAVQVILETVGQDLQKIKNELIRISLQNGATDRVLTKNDIAAHLGALKEDDIYQLDRYLLDKKWPLATSLLFNLLDRGEKPLSVLAILANHCRNVLNVCDGISKGFTPFEISNRTRLPSFIMKTYLQSAKNVRVPTYTNALSACHSADRTLKSSPVDDKLVLGQIITALTGG